MSMTVKNLLWLYGHQYCPENVQQGNVLTTNEWQAAPMSHIAIIAAVRSYQSMFRDELDLRTFRSKEYGGYRRASIADGTLGPCTVEVIGIARCLCPDYYHPDKLKEQGNWPDACRFDITCSRDFNKLPGRTAVQTDEDHDATIEEWNSRIHVKLKRVEGYPNTRITTTLANLPGSTLADQYLATSNCGFSSRGRMDIRDWSRDGLAQAVWTHEYGHALGLQHVPDGKSTMNPAITNACIERKGRLIEGDLTEAKRVGYKIRDKKPDIENWVEGPFAVRVLNDDGTFGATLGTFDMKPTSDLVIHEGKIVIDGVCVLDTGARPNKFILMPKTEWTK